MSKVKPRLLQWSTKAQLILPAVKQDRELAVMVDSETCVVLALEVPRIANVRDSLARVEHAVATVLDQHAHRYVGRGETLHEALELAESYARRWLIAASNEDECSCGEIEAAP